MKELEQLIQKLETENLKPKDRLLITKRIIQLSEEDSNSTKHSIYNSLLMLINNQIELEALLKETFQEFEASQNRSHNTLMNFIREMKDENNKNMEDLKKTLENLEKTVTPLKQSYDNNNIFRQELNKYKGLLLSLSGTIVAGGTLLAFIRYIILN
jgi:hypothetical protein